MTYEYIIFFILAFIVSFIATPFIRKIAFNVGAVDIPVDNRRMHKKPTARLGGMAIIIGFLVALIFNVVFYNSNSLGFIIDGEIIGLLVGIGVIVLIGLIDDIKSLNAKKKLLFQIVASILVVLISEIRIQRVTNPFVEEGVFELNMYISILLTIFWIVGVTNAINLIDGLDGLAAGVSSISYLSLFFVSILSANPISAFLTIILAGATLGFLPYNFNPAKIFMGDTGSMFLGFTLAVISIQGTLKSYTIISIVIPILVLGLPLFDTTFTILRRVIRKKSIMQADRGHLHHRLIDMGFSQKQSVVIMYTTSGILGLTGIMLANKGVWSAILLIVVLSVFIIGVVKYLSTTEYTKERIEAEKESELDNSLLYENTSLIAKDANTTRN